MATLSDQGAVLTREWRRAAVVNHCRVDAGGVCAEWVEANPASEDQPTLVFFVADRHVGDAIETTRPLAWNLAVATRARVLTVACASGDGVVHGGTVEEGVAAYAWLLGEGCDLDLTAFVSERAEISLATAVLFAAVRRGLPPPVGGVCEARADTLVAAAALAR